MGKNKKPPKMAAWILNRIFTDGKNTSIADFEEVFDLLCKKKNPAAAWVWCWFQVVVSLKDYFKYKLSWSFVMFKNYLKIAIRNIKKQKFYSLINLFGLAIGFFCCILIFCYVQFELSYDKFHAKGDRIFRLVQKNYAVTNPPTAPLMKQDYPEIEETVRIIPRGRLPLKYKDIQHYEEHIYYTNPSFFKVFSFPLIKGDPEEVFQSGYTAVITEEIALKYFGDNDPLGKIINLNNNENYTVTGVLKNIPDNSHLQFNILLSFETYRIVQNNRIMEMWQNNYISTYMLLRKNVNFNDLEKKFSAFVEKYMSELDGQYGEKTELYLQPLDRIHLYSNLTADRAKTGDIKYIYIFSSIALFVLALACINYMNLSTARSVKRAKEIGLRKVSGADKAKIIKQFIVESVLFVFLAFIISIFFAYALIPVFKTLTGIQLNFTFSDTAWILPLMILLIIIVGISAGSYPAFFLSSFQPVAVLKSNFTGSDSRSLFRKILVFLQFAVSISLIIGTGIISKQIKFLKNKRLGFNKEQIVCLPVMDNNVLNSVDAIKKELLKHPDIINVSASLRIPGGSVDYVPMVPEGFEKTESVTMFRIPIDENFIPALGIEISEGRNFSDRYSSDVENSVIINETAVKRFGWKNPIGKTIVEYASPDQTIKKTVVGVVKDFHFKSLREGILPMYIEYTKTGFNFISIRFDTGKVSEVMNFLENKWKTFDPGRPFEYIFLDDTFDNMYRTEEKMQQLFSYFTFLAIFIALLGLFGLAAFTVERRTREIGIRKVLGAPVTNIIYLILKEFVILVLLANIIAWPLSWFIMNKWLLNFAYRTGIGFEIFLFSAFIALFVAVVTVSSQALKAAVANPVDSLKNE